MKHKELVKVSNWSFPRVQDLGAIDKKLIHNKEKLLSSYHYLIDEFFAFSPLSAFYELLLQSYKSLNQKVFKSRCLTMFLMLQHMVQSNPKHYAGGESSIATAKALVYWQIHLVRKLIGLQKYGGKVSKDIELPSANDPKYSIGKTKLYNLVCRYHPRLMDLYFKIYK